jgi:hypothetical protein
MHRSKMMWAVARLLDHLVGAGEQRGGNVDTQDLRRLQIDDELEFAGAQDWQAARRAFQRLRQPI